MNREERQVGFENHISRMAFVRSRQGWKQMVTHQKCRKLLDLIWGAGERDVAELAHRFAIQTALGHKIFLISEEIYWAMRQGMSNSRHTSYTELVFLFLCLV